VEVQSHRSETTFQSIQRLRKIKIKKKERNDVSAIWSDGGISEQGINGGVPDRHRRSPIRRSRGRQYRPSPRQQVRFREVRSSQAFARSHRSGLRRL